MLRLALASLRQRLAAFLGTFLAATLAAMLISASAVLMFSALASGAGVDRFDRATAMVSAPREVVIENEKGKSKGEDLPSTPVLPADLVAQIEGRPGVADAVADTSFATSVLRSDGSLATGRSGAAVFGHGWQSAPLTPFELRTGNAPGPGEIVLDVHVAAEAGVKAGDQVRVGTRTGVHMLRVVGTAAPPGEDGLATQGAVFVADAEVRRLSGLAGPTAIGVLAASGTSADALAREVRAATPGVRVLTGGGKVDADAVGVLADYTPAVSTFATSGGITVFAALVILIGTVAFTARQRLRELALLRATGATPRQLRRMLRVESLLLTLVAGAVGAVLGGVLAAALADTFRGGGVVPLAFQARMHPLVVLGSILLTVVAGQIATAVAARRATRIAPTEALREAVTEPPARPFLRTVAGLVLFLGACAVLLFTPMAGSVGIGMSFIACVLLLAAAAAFGPAIVTILGGTLGRVLAGTGAVGQLAVANTLTATRRVTGVAVPIMLMVALNGVMMLNNVTLGEVARDEQQARTGAADLVLTDRNATGFPWRLAEDAADAPGVTGVAATVPTTVIIDEGRRPAERAAVGLFLGGTDAPMDLDVSAGSLGDLRAGTVAISEGLAGDRGWQVGDTQPFWLPDGVREELRVVAVYGRAIGLGDVVLPAEFAVEHGAGGFASALYVRASDGGAQVRRQLTQLWPPLAADDSGSAGQTRENTGTAQGSSLILLAMITVGFIAIAVVNTFAVAASERTGEFAKLRLAGATTGQLRRMCTAETVLIVAIGLILGTAIAGVIVNVFSLRQDGQLRLLVDPVLFLGLIAGTAVLGVLGGVLPSRIFIRRGERRLVEAKE